MVSRNFSSHSGEGAALRSERHHALAAVVALILAAVSLLAMSSGRAGAATRAVTYYNQGNASNSQYSISLSPSQETVYLGDTLTWTITLKNLTYSNSLPDVWINGIYLKSIDVVGCDPGTLTWVGLNSSDQKRVKNNEPLSLKPDNGNTLVAQCTKKIRVAADPSISVSVSGLTWVNNEPLPATWTQAGTDQEVKPAPPSNSNGGSWNCSGGPIVFDAYSPSNTYTTLGVQTQNSTSFINKGNNTFYSYNSLAFNPKDNYLYAITNGDAPSSPLQHLLRIDGDGGITDLGEIRNWQSTGEGATKNIVMSGGFNTGFFDDDGNYWVSNGSVGHGGQGKLYKLDLTTRSLNTTPFGGSGQWAGLFQSSSAGVNDFTYKDGFAWGITTPNDAWGEGYMARVNLRTGELRRFSGVPGLRAGIYGAAWTYGNGNLGFDHNGGGVWQIAVDDPASSSPSFRLVATSDGPRSQNNDGAAGCVKENPTDYTLEKSVTDPVGSLEVLPGQSISWTVTAINWGPGISSGFTVFDNVPRGLTNVRAEMLNPNGGFCTVIGNQVSCVSQGQVPVGATRAMRITAQAPKTEGVCFSNTATIVPNEADANVVDNTKTSQQICTTAPKISVDKWSNTMVLESNPQTVTYYYDVAPWTDISHRDRSDPAKTGTGTRSSEQLEQIEVTDDKCSPVVPAYVRSGNPSDPKWYVKGDKNYNGLLDFDEVWNYSCSTRLTQRTTNTATATGVGFQSRGKVTATDRWTVTVPTPEIGIVKTADTKMLTKMPQTVTYSFEVRARSASHVRQTVTGAGVNQPDDHVDAWGAMSGEPVRDVNVVDPLCASAPRLLSGDTNRNGLLEVFEVWKYECTSSLTQATTNTATVTGKGVVSLKPVSDADWWYVDAPPLAITKVSSANGVPQSAGSIIKYTVTVTNTGNTDQTHVTLKDIVPEGTTYVPKTAFLTAPKDGTQTGTWKSGTLPTITFPDNCTTNPCQQKFSPGAAIPQGAQLLRYRVTMGGSSLGYRNEVSVVASDSGGHGFNFSLPKYSFGDATKVAPWITQTKSGNLTGTHSSQDTYQLAWSDSFNNAVSPDQTADNVSVEIDWTMSTQNNFTGAAHDPTRTAPSFLVTAEDNITLHPGQTMTVEYQVKVTPKAGQTSVVNTATASSDRRLEISATVKDPLKAANFKVEKLAAGTEKDAAGNFRATLNPNGTYTAEYDVKVTNISVSSTGEHPMIEDFFTARGFQLREVRWTGGGAAGSVEASGETGSIVIPAGPARGPLAPGGSETYRVAVTLVPDASVNWATVGTCKTAGAGDPNLGLFNRITMTGDGDGTDNNDACVTVKPQEEIAVTKLGTGCDTDQMVCDLAGSDFAIFDQDPSSPGASAISNAIVANQKSDGDVNGATFKSIPLDINKFYWLVETKAPEGHELLAQPVRFHLESAGAKFRVVIDSNTGPSVKVASDNQLNIEVIDQTTVELPYAGGRGFWPYAITALALITAAGVMVQQKQYRPRRAA